MPLQNRVDPSGQLRFAHERGALMGNRGILHDATSRAILVQWRHKAWVACDPSFKRIKRKIFGSNTYSELFFLDEATAFSAGHRPCSYCRRERLREFKAAWVKVNRQLLSADEPSVADIDKVLHAERAVRGGGKVVFEAPLADLPVGTFFKQDGEFIVVGSQGLLHWTFGGYTPWEAAHAERNVSVLTPASIVRVYKAGFVPCFDRTATIHDV